MSFPLLHLFGSARALTGVQFMEIKNTKNGKTAFGLVRDSCPGCGSGDIGRSPISFQFKLGRYRLFTSKDMSPSLFQSLGATLDQGIVSVQWHFMKKGFKP